MRLSAAVASAILVSLSALAGSASAQEPQVLDHPKWARTPSPGDLEAFYPQAARQPGTKGRAEVWCLTTAEGRLTDCTVSSEDPVGLGFGEATVKLASRFQLKAGTFSEGMKVRIPVRWSLSG